MSTTKGQEVCGVFALIVVVILAVLKIAGAVDDLEWWFILSPIWAPIAALIPMFLLIVIISKNK